MDKEALIQLIITTGTILSSAFLTLRYFKSQANKKDKTFLDFIEKMQEQQLLYYETKNGHLERISNEFSKTLTKISKSVDKLSSLIKNKE